MNLIIEKLKVQATSYTWNGDGVTEELDEELFAQLIVRECVEFVPSATQSNAILKHFGVK